MGDLSQQAGAQEADAKRKQDEAERMMEVGGWVMEADGQINHQSKSKVQCVLQGDEERMMEVGGWFNLPTTFCENRSRTVYGLCAARARKGVAVPDEADRMMEVGG